MGNEPPVPWHLPLAPLAGVVLAWALFGPPAIVPFVFGILGWSFAILLRAPLALLVRAMPGRRQVQTMVAASGPIEEVVRLGALAVAADQGWSDAVWLGLGWSLAETLAAGAQVMAIRGILRAGGEKAQALRAQLANAPQGGGRALATAERAGTTAAHVGFALWLQAAPELLLVAMAAHSLLNAGALFLARRSVLLAEAFVLAKAIAILGIGLACFDLLL